ncbi:MAG TPA: aldolase/citrate lyase family protein [Acidimicrobiales bacterium]|nr:aldolase/citrate lyase family protein [Acidimicrobiales bacterium]
MPGAADGDDRVAYINLFAFANNSAAARAVVGAGATGVVVDWERRGKRARQAGADTQINADTPADLAAVRAAQRGVVLCRVNRWSAWTPAEIDVAIGLGADEILLPMVRRSEEVDAALDVVDGRCRLGILVETTDAVRRVDSLVTRPLSRIYLGLNDLMIDRGGSSLFAPLVDGTVDRVAAATIAAGIPFGVAGLTRPEDGRPVPCRLVVGALARVSASFTFLRRSFWADTAGRDLTVEVPRILFAAEMAGQRPARQVDADHAALAAAVGLLGQEQAV